MDYSTARPVKVNLIVAYDENRVIGDGDQIPWRLSEDMAQFKRRTVTHAVIMGRKTYMSIPPKFRPLPQRFNIVLSEAYGYPDLGEGIAIAHDIDEALYFAKAFNHVACKNQVWVAGGAKVYQDFLREDDLVDCVIASEVKGKHKGDAYFPELKGEWGRVLLHEYDGFSVVAYTRKGHQCSPDLSVLSFP